MDFQQVVAGMSPEIYRNFKRALELGKWPDGRVLSKAQKETVLQAIIAWDAQHLEENQRVGFIDKGSKAGDVCDEPEVRPLNWQD